MKADQAAPQGPCPLSGGARRAGIGSRDDEPPPHGHAAWMGHSLSERFAKISAGQTLCPARRFHAEAGDVRRK